MLQPKKNENVYIISNTNQLMQKLVDQLVHLLEKWLVQELVLALDLRLVQDLVILFVYFGVFVFFFFNIKKYKENTYK